MYERDKTSIIRNAIYQDLDGIDKVLNEMYNQDRTAMETLKLATYTLHTVKKYIDMLLIGIDYFKIDTLDQINSFIRRRSLEGYYSYITNMRVHATVDISYVNLPKIDMVEVKVKFRNVGKRNSDTGVLNFGIGLDELVDNDLEDIIEMISEEVSIVSDREFGKVVSPLVYRTI